VQGRSVGSSEKQFSFLANKKQFTIMAHPKRRQSKTRTRKRRTHDKAVAPTLAICPNCGEFYVYHTVCQACGYYRGKVAIVKETAI
jgi:large subunit ribosomal protein L32